MHLQGNFVDSVITGKLGGLLPVWNYSFLPLPIEHLTVLGRPTVGDPVGHSLGGAAAGAAGKTDDNAYSETLSQQYGAPESLRIALRDLRVRGHRVAVATQCRHLNIAVFEFLFPGASFGRIVQQILYRAMRGIRIATSSDFHRLHTPAGELVDHLVCRKIGEGGVENTDWNLAQCSSRRGLVSIRQRVSGQSRRGLWRSDGGGQQAGGGEKISSATGVGCGLRIHGVSSGSQVVRRQHYTNVAWVEPILEVHPRAHRGRCPHLPLGELRG